MESYTTSKHSTNTSTACDTSSIKVDINIYIYIYTFILERSAGSIPIRAPSAPESRFSAISPPLGVVSSRGLRPAIALSREGLARVRVRPRRGRRAALARWQGRVSAVSHTRPNHSPVSLQRPVCRGPRTVPRSRSFFRSLSGSLQSRVSSTHSRSSSPYD